MKPSEMTGFHIGMTYNIIKEVTMLT